MGFNTLQTVSSTQKIDNTCIVKKGKKLFFKFVGSQIMESNISRFTSPKLLFHT
jgi:hypothetical protein